MLGFLKNIWYNIKRKRTVKKEEETMDLIKIFTGISVAAAEVQKAMADRELTIKEMCDIVDSTLRATAGFGLDSVGLKITKENGKTHISIVIGNEQGQ